MSGLTGQASCRERRPGQLRQVFYLYLRNPRTFARDLRITSSISTFNRNPEFFVRRARGDWDVFRPDWHQSSMRVERSSHRAASARPER